jgi:hypothetical protein
MPVPLSRILIPTRSPKVFGRGCKGRLLVTVIRLRRALGRHINLLREAVNIAGGRVLGPLQRDVEPLLLRSRPVIPAIHR